MKFLRILKKGSELEGLVLHSPYHLIGRSPHCDLVLRAKGVQSVHFLIEWIGNDKFSSSQGRWAVFDISSANTLLTQGGNEGVILEDGPNAIGDFVFSLEESRLESVPKLGGRVMATLEDTSQSTKALGKNCLEMICVHAQTGALEDLGHVDFHSKIPQRIRPFRYASSGLEIEVSEDSQSEPKFQLKAGDWSDAKFFIGSQSVLIDQVNHFHGRELLRIQRKGHVAYLRLVPKVEGPKVPQMIFEESGLRALMLYIFAPLSLVLIVMAIVGVGGFSAVHVNTEPDRVVKVEIPSAATPEAPPQLPESSVPQEASASTGTTVKSSAQQERIVVSQLAARKNVNRLGVLGALGGGAGATQVAKVDRQSLIDKVPSTENASLILKSTPNGILGKNDKGLQKNSLAQDLSKASSGAAGAGIHSGTSGSLIAGNNSARDSGDIARIGSVNGGKGEFTFGNASVTKIAGGLDRETVRGIVRSSQADLQLCYERSLLRNSSLGGRFLFEWKILANGSVTNVRLKSAPQKAPEFIACVTELLSGMKYPQAKSGGDTMVVYPFEFKPTK